jgi:DNA invertase Pin-like site-specific DNA recombinase
MRAALYARYSTDRQSESSIDDQVRVCEEYAARHGMTVVARHADEGISGAAIGNRPAFGRLMDDAAARAFDVILVVDLSRLSRSAGDLNKTIDRMVFAGVRVIGVSDGYDSSRRGHKLQAGVQGVTGEAFREMTRYRTHEALLSRAASQHFAGGRAYGYRSEPAGSRRRLVVCEPEAAIVREIFARFAAGESIREIVYDLNARQVPAPRGSTWAVSTLFGSPRKGSGILNNELYAGRYIWNRSQFVKDPDTGKRHRRERDRSEWIITSIPGLAIVEESIWSQAAARLARRKPIKTGRKPSYLLSGILRCGMCGGAYVVVYRNQYGCAAHKDRGPAVCRNGLRVARADIEREILAMVKRDLLSPEAIQAFRAELALEIRAARREDHAKPLHARIERLDAEIGHLVEAIRTGSGSRSLLAALESAEAESDRLRDDLAALSAPVPEIIPGALDEYRKMVESLETGAIGAPEATRADLAELLGKIPLTPVPGRQEIEAQLEGAYTGLLRIATGGRMQTTVVAGAGFGSYLRFRATGKVV